MDIDPLPIFSLCNVPAIEFHAPDSWLSWTVIVLIAVLCLGLSAFVSGSEIAYFGLSQSDREFIDDEQTREELPAAAKVSALLARSERLLATILIANNMVNITMVVLLSFAINQAVTFNSTILNFLLQTVFLTFLLLLCGEIFPKLVAKGRPLKWALSSARGVTLLFRLLKGPASLMEKSSGIVHRIISKHEESISTDDLSQALEMSDEPAGKDKEMLEGILSFGEKNAADIMISRVDITDIEFHEGFDQVVNVIRSTGYSRIPVYDTNRDNIKGILYSKDMLAYVGERDDSFAWQSLVRQPYFVPESRMIDDLLEDFRNKHIHIAVVVDEYGGTQGIVTLEDIIEEIVGDIDDEYDEDSPLFKQLSPDTFVFEGKIPLIDFCRITETDPEDYEQYGEAETLAGLLLAVKGDFPSKKEALTVGRCRFLVLDIQKHRIISVRCNVIPKDEQ
ncbi:MAG: gliding motility-associated protein GldE [Prevotella sp.]|nr:gliding motility-associated protein GldE [Prevotella sp.]MCM1075629.1 gliding motility-associated protein GldE [Ruminococcus sp.]